MNKWIDVDKELPKCQQDVLAYYKNEYGKDRIVKAMYIEPYSVLAEDFFDDYDETFTDYSDVEDKYYVQSDWYERVENWDYMSCLIHDPVTHWQPLPEPPKDK